QLRARGHEQKRLGGRYDIRIGIEKDTSNLIAEHRTSWLAHGDHLAPAGGEPLRQQSELRALPGALRSLEYDEHSVGGQDEGVGPRVGGYWLAATFLAPSPESLAPLKSND